MATNTLKLKFGTASGEKTFSFPNVKANPSKESVKTLVQRMIENGSIYKYPPLTVQSAIVEIVQQSVIDLSD